MAYELPKQALDYIRAGKQELIDLLKALCAIPSPSHQEGKRAAFCKKWLEDNGAEGVYIDEAQNVVFPVNAKGSDRLTFFLAHTDTVFPDLTPMPMADKDGWLHCPGVGDDTAGVAILLMIAKYIIKNGIRPKNGWVLVCNSCEEALGNLKGVKQLMKDYANRVKEVYIMDGLYNQVVNWPVASTRYEVTVKTEGGHAYLNFGNKNAIHCLSSMVCDLYATPIPRGCKSSYNVGLIGGGTSINAIAQDASMRVEIRSELVENLEHLNRAFEEIVEKHRAMGYDVQVEVIGRRPGKGPVDPERQEKIDRKLREILTGFCGKPPIFRSGSGDLNIPMSMGIPGIGWAAYEVVGVHTREERLNLESLQTGLSVNLAVALSCLEEE